MQAIRRHTEFLQKHARCPRCNSYYPKTLAQCSVCSHLPDAELAAIVRQRRAFRISLGKSMLIGAIFLIILIFVLARKLGAS